MNSMILLFDPYANVYRPVVCNVQVVQSQPQQPGILQQLWEAFMAFVRAFMEECGRLFAQRLLASANYSY